jgi:hypothetical protein
VTDARPDPLVPAQADLRDFGFMPLDIVRLFGSRFHAVANDSEWRAGVTLWAKSFHQVPAASLPDDDIELCRLAELGRDMKTWKKVRAIALHGWIACSDDRLYHPVVAEKANEAWSRKEAQRERSRRGNAARWGLRDHHEDEPETRQGIHNASSKDAPAIQDASLKDPKGQGQGQGQGQGLFGDSGSAPAPTPPTPPPDFTGNNAEALNGKAIVCIGKGFELPVDWGFDAEKLGFNPKNVVYEAERFRQYWAEGKGKGTRRSVKGWRQAWSNWLAKASERQQR